MDFSDHIFQDNVCFSNRILVNASFKCVNFCSLADFRNATFVGVVDFGKSNFEMRSRFDDAEFENTVYFRSTTFKETTVFDRAKFKVSAYFEKSNFISIPGIMECPFGGVGFRNAIFTSEMSFRGSLLEVLGDFEGAKFRDTADFQSVVFSKNANFRRTDFGRVADFSYAEFKQESNFSDTSFESTTYFRFTNFDEPPKFFEADLHEDTDFSGVDWHRSERNYTASFWSVRRALISWFLHFVGMGLFLFTQAWSSTEEWHGILWDSLLVSFANAHAFLGLAGNGGYLYGARLRLAAEVNDVSVLNAVGVLEAVIGPILLFLLLLTLRNRFRLR